MHPKNKTANCIIVLFILFILFLQLNISAQNSNGKIEKSDEKQLYSECITAVDQYGRSFNAVSSYNPAKKVGMFFWLWIGQPYASGIYDATQISQMPEGEKLLYDFKFRNDSISPNLQAHYWGRPVWGYYNSDDEWVIRKQIQMLTAAGIDFIVFDATNSITYPEVYRKILKVISEYIKAGINAPRAAFYTHSRSIQTTLKLYDELYSRNLYPDSWYYVNGKPFIVAYTSVDDDVEEALTRNDTSYRPEPLPKNIINFFSIRKPQWPFDPVYENGFPWIEWTFPQPVHNNMMNVTVASHPNVPMSRTITHGVENWGRGWDPVLRKNISDNVDKGTFFQLQWNHALEVNPDTIFVGGWNEWIAIKQPWGDEYMLCDAASKEFSRDIEPMHGGYQDAFYIQLIKNIRQYKGIGDNSTYSSKTKIDIDKGTEQWDTVKYAYINTDDKMISRNSFGGSKTIVYTQPAPVNRLKQVKVCHDDDYIYFLIQSDNDLKLNNDSTNSLNLFIGTGEASVKGWESYEYVIGRYGSSKSRYIEKLSQDFTGSRIGDAEYTITCEYMQIRVPRKLLGLTNGINSFYFKVADNISQPSDIMDYYVSGISLPPGRLSFSYKIK